ncbi:MAG: ABC transporter ATP-binding protein [Deltaproteobacteria bacterium]
MIEVSGLTRRFRERTAVQDLTFSIGRGAVVGLLGPNGAGKTTTLRLLTGFLPPSAGTVRVAGFDVFEQPMEARRRIGYLPEIPPLYDGMTVREQLRFAADLKGLPRARVREEVERVAGLTSVDGVLDRLTANLSKGFRQRVGIAQALVGDPDVLILDEPTVGLDPIQIREVRDLIRSLGGRHTVLLSSHLLPEVAMTCSQVIVLNEGRLVGFDTLDGLVARHLPGRRVTVHDIAFLEEIFGKLVTPA